MCIRDRYYNVRNVIVLVDSIRYCFFTKTFNLLSLCLCITLGKAIANNIFLFIKTKFIDTWENCLFPQYSVTCRFTGPLINSVTPVSYTHLDVYKRQEQMFGYSTNTVRASADGRFFTLPIKISVI